MRRGRSGEGLDREGWGREALELRRKPIDRHVAGSSKSNQPWAAFASNKLKLHISIRLFDTFSSTALTIYILLSKFYL